MRNNFQAHIQEYGSVYALLLLIVTISIISPDFRSTGNILSLLRQSSVTGLLAFGMTLIILTGGIDLSVGSTLALSAALCAGLITSVGVPVPIAMLITLIFGTFLGFITGVLITFGKLQPFIATLITMTTYRGLTLIYMGGRPISNLTKDEYVMAGVLKFVGRGEIAGIPFPIILFLFAFIIFFIFLNKMTIGRKIYATGSNATCAQLAGVNVSQIKLFVYSLSGLMAALSSILLISRLNSAQPTLGLGYELDAIAAVALGGTSMNGGRGKISGTLVGILIITVLSNGLNMLNVQSYYQDVVKGIVILIAVLADQKDDLKN
ncbi:MAG: ABC transporter permease [Brevinema sp.]